MEVKGEEKKLRCEFIVVSVSELSASSAASSLGPAVARFVTDNGTHALRFLRESESVESIQLDLSKTQVDFVMNLSFAFSFFFVFDNVGCKLV